MRISDWSSDVCSSDLSNTGYTWAENAHEFRLTPWHDDPVSDPGGEAFYIRDEQTGRLWSPTPLPIPGDGAYRVRHGFGYSRSEGRRVGPAGVRPCSSRWSPHQSIQTCTNSTTPLHSSTQPT